MATEYSEYTTKIADKEDEITRWEDYYYNKFSSMESALAQLNQTQSSLDYICTGCCLSGQFKTHMPQHCCLCAGCGAERYGQRNGNKPGVCAV